MWYRDFDAPVFDFQKQPNGNYTIGVQLGENEGLFNEVNPSGEVVAQHRAETVQETGPLELRLFEDGSRLLYGVRRVETDLTQFGGVANAEFHHNVVEYRSSGETFTWTTELGMNLTDGVDGLTSSVVKPYQINAIERDTDGNLLVSMRNASQIIKIDVSTGFEMWRLGGERNQFVLIGDQLSGFHRQHGVRRLPNGNILIFDNGNEHSPQVSRAVEYQLDETFKTATFVGEYRVPDLFAEDMGFAQRLTNGNTVVCYGTARVIREVSPQNRALWEIQPISGELPYRAMKVPSLY